MNTIIISVFVVLALYNVVCGEQYAGKLDNVDVDAVLKNDRLLQNYAKCLLGKGTCTQEGHELKSHIKEALESDCGRCSDKQKANLKKVIVHLAKNKPEIWKELVARYDPDGAFRNQYADLLKEAGVASE